MEINRDKIGIEILRDLINKSNDAIFVNDPQTGRFVFVNDKACSSLGYDRRELLKMGVIDIETTFPDTFSWQAHVDELRQRGSHMLEGLHKRKDGATFPVEATISYVVLNSREYMVAIVRDITEHKRAEEELRELNARLQALVSAIPDLVVFKDTGGRHLIVNRALEEFTGLSQKELVGKTNADLLPPGLSEACDKSDEEVLKGLKPVRVEERFAGREGENRYFDTIKVPIFDSRDGVAGIVGVSREITDRKKIEEQIKTSLKEKEILLKEIHHRVKNNLNVISSLLNLQARHIVDAKLADIFRDCQNRIVSMALIHEKLYKRGDLLKIDLNEYIESLMSSLLSLYVDKTNNVVVRTNIEDIVLDIDASIPCGLIINELVTNSLKHAFHAGRGGQVFISFCSDDGKYTLSVKDDGSGLPKGLDLKSPKTLGLQLVDALTKQLGGSLEIISGGGTDFRITFEGKKPGSGPGHET